MEELIPGSPSNRIWKYGKKFWGEKLREVGLAGALARPSRGLTTYPINI